MKALIRGFGFHCRARPEPSTPNPECMDSVGSENTTSASFATINTLRSGLRVNLSCRHVVQGVYRVQGFGLGIGLGLKVGMRSSGIEFRVQGLGLRGYRVVLLLFLEGHGRQRIKHVLQKELRV